MRPNIRLFVLRLAAFFPAVLWYRLIWGFSAQTADVSGTLSDGLLWRALAAVSAAFAGAETTLQTASVEFLSFFVRKAAHMFLYFVLALLVYLALCRLFRCGAARTALALLTCGLLACLDEYHQTMVPGRSGEVRDVLVDLCGSAVMLAILALPALSDRLRRGPRLSALVPAALCVLPALSALLPPEALDALPVLETLVLERVPGTDALARAELARLAAELAPILRDVLFLAVCGLTGACVPAAAGLTGIRRRAALAAVFAAAAAAGASALVFDVSFPPAAAGVVGAGALMTALLWGFSEALNEKRPAG